MLVKPDLRWNTSGSGQKDCLEDYIKFGGLHKTMLMTCDLPGPSEAQFCPIVPATFHEHPEVRS